MLWVGPLAEGLVLVQEEGEEGSQCELRRLSTPTCKGRKSVAKTVSLYEILCTHLPVGLTLIAGLRQSMWYPCKDILIKPVFNSTSLTVNLIAGVAYEHLIVVTSLPTYRTHFAVDTLPRLQVFGNQSF